MYVLFAMFVTFPTSHVERLPLKATAPLNTAPQQQRKVQGKKWVWKKRGALFENRISAEKEAGKKKQPKKDPIVERGESVYVRPYICVTSPTSQVERSRLKALAPSNTAQPQRKVKG